jgi:hypothetical protein
MQKLLRVEQLGEESTNFWQSRKSRLKENTDAINNRGTKSFNQNRSEKGQIYLTNQR